MDDGELLRRQYTLYLEYPVYPAFNHLRLERLDLGGDRLNCLFRRIRLSKRILKLFFLRLESFAHLHHLGAIGFLGLLQELVLRVKTNAVRGYILSYRTMNDARIRSRVGNGYRGL